MRDATATGRTFTATLFPLNLPLYTRPKLPLPSSGPRSRPGMGVCGCVFCFRPCMHERMRQRRCERGLTAGQASVGCRRRGCRLVHDSPRRQ